MKNIPDILAVKLRDKLASIMFYDTTGVINTQSHTLQLRDMIMNILLAVDGMVGDLCRPHDFIPVRGSDNVACARCGELAHRHPDGKRLIVESTSIPSIKLPKPMSPEEEAISNVMGEQSGFVNMRKREPGEEIRL